MFPSFASRLNDILGTWGVPLVVLLVGLASFGLGRFSMIEEMRPQVSLQHATAAEALPPMNMGGLLVGSRNGSTYHFPWCAGAKQITEQNKRWFKSEEEAQKAGYRPAKNCKGLE
ncbi:hypothetical protein A2673_00850 [Candidatus Kaiserbacteria bacterium RIFCSPHIGHO2_01_FULL_50_13]|uniref:Ada DNA repair metal-binding domain-containing protein n=1 Tax=Candidatus Kaiserbacteria bacterium RIFCSPLOWO2_01_FULL_50_24 TaxID=1798507 RepID=A0A1F6EMU7_9BACT|nr:MAG: hypothetical protein A2673_00850 [Candidatus Kaiserbacteria bacterium RIFCSPHIGHO2_01_FULL_50_13]OGG74973.1 MAG: hypothetical protein A3A34_04115 [Candidatus Kaiserbacteria bacterium RIFCSPLOWO2_01_FULL_50_24]OGG81775.1 MAG: hypothetical protein A3H74_01190 [Candidatus Kaiserbacteria bacterium RIFCSPLOWO2_02_FULL_51_13]